MEHPVTDELIDFTASFEGVRLHAYQDGGGLWTIGYGSRRMPNGGAVKAGDTITEPEAKQLLGVQLQGAMATVNGLVTHPVSQHQAEALADFVFNVGPGNFARSDVLRLANDGQLEAAGAAFLGWVHDAKGEVEPGLERRAKARETLFQS